MDKQGIDKVPSLTHFQKSNSMTKPKILFFSEEFLDRAKKIEQSPIYYKIQES